MFFLEPASHGGQKLLHTADINISSCVTSFFRCRVKSQKTGNEKAKDLRQASWFGKKKKKINILGFTEFILGFTEEI